MKRLRLVALPILLFLGPVASPAGGEDRPRIAAVRSSGPIHVDGILGEPDWERASPITAFRRIEVREGEAPSESTDVRVLISGTHLYFGIRCWNRGASPIRASLAPRDQILDDDHIAVHLDTYHDSHRAYIFGVNPYGVELDGILDGEDPDFAWDAVWDVAVQRQPDRWVAEMAIPLRSLRFPPGHGPWGVWFRRQITRNDEVCSWPLWRKDVGGDIMVQAADLDGLEGLRGGGRAEVQPYVASTSASSRAAAGGTSLSPWRYASDPQAGLDVKYGVTSTLTANATINPDYSQIEADALQIDVNRRFPLFFTEKRPFFLEGAETYATLFKLVYTRRIANPAYGAKLTGKLGRWRLGAIGVRDDGGGSTDGIGARSDGGASRSGSFGIGRATYDIGESSNMGVLVTTHFTDGVAGAVPAVVGFRAPGRTYNTVASADAKFRLAKSLFVAGQVARSSTRVDSVTGAGGLRGAPFSDYLSTIAGWWQDGTRYAVVYQDYLGADFRADAGFLERVDDRNTGYEAYWTFRPENRWLRSIQPRSNGDIIRDTRGALEERRLAGAIEWSFQRQTWAETRLAHVDERWRARVYDRWRYIVELGNSLWRPLSAEIEATLEDGIFYGDADSTSYLGWQEQVALSATLRPSPRLTSELSATRSRFLRARGGGIVYDFWLLGARTTCQFTRRLYMRLYPQYDAGAGHLDLDALVAYVVHPGSVLYLGVNRDLDRLGSRYRATQRTMFLKASYVFQI